MRIRTLIRSAALAVAVSGLAGAAMAQDSAGVAAPEAAVALAPEAPIAPWYQSFTQNGNRLDLTTSPLDRNTATVELDASSRWGVTLGLERTAPSSREEVDGLSAGAFFKISPRVRVGGELGYRAQGDAAGLRPAETPSSQVKLESAFRF